MIFPKDWMINFILWIKHKLFRQLLNNLSEEFVYEILEIKNIGNVKNFFLIKINFILPMNCFI